MHVQAHMLTRRLQNYNSSVQHVQDRLGMARDFDVDGEVLASTVCVSQKKGNECVTAVSG